MLTSTGCISRRRFCAGACQAVSGATLATMFTGCTGGDSPTSPSSRAVELGVVSGRYTGSSVEVDVAGTALTGIGGAVLVQSVAGVLGSEKIRMRVPADHVFMNLHMWVNGQTPLA